MIEVKRAYETAEGSEGKRFLVDRLWPRGTRKEDLKLAGWVREVAPSNRLRQWFKHDPEKWPEFQRRYAAELKQNPDGWAELAAAARQGDLTLVYGAKDTQHNNAVALRSFLEQHLGSPRRARAKRPARKPMLSARS